MPLFVRDKKTKKVYQVRKYIISGDGVENIWSNEWYGRHVIGLDCEWARPYDKPETLNLDDKA